MSILVLNSGSSSLKYKLFNETDQSILNFGEIKNYDDSSIKFEHDNKEEMLPFDVWGRRLDLVLKQVDVTGLKAILHRVVHGGEEFKEPTVITADMLTHLKDDLSNLAPLHNPFAFEIIEKCLSLFSGVMQIGVFDTSFGLTMPKENFIYAIPSEYYEKYKIRRYAFHGISHKYVSESYHKYIVNEQNNTSENEVSGEQKDSTKIVSVHLGSGCSTCAIEGTQCVDTSFGFTPDENLVMSSRVGEIDYSAVQMIQDKDSLSDNDIRILLNQKSGLLALSKYTKDMKVLLTDYNTNADAKFAIDVFVKSVTKQILNMINSLRGIDVLIFTGGIGQGSDIIRQMVCERLDILGVYIDVDKNVNSQNIKRITNITKLGSKSEIIIVPTNEELEMLIESVNLIN